MKIKKVLHYSALVLGLMASAFYTLFLISDAVSGLFEGKADVIPLLIMMIIAVAGYIWSVKNPRKGGLSMIAGGFIMSLYLLIMGGIEGLEMALIFGSPFITPGLIFYFTSDVKQTV